MDSVKAIMDETKVTVPPDVAEGIVAVEDMLDDLTNDTPTDANEESTETGEVVPAEGGNVESKDEIQPAQTESPSEPTVESTTDELPKTELETKELEGE